MAEGQRGSTDEGDQGDDCTEAGRSVIGFTIIGEDERGYAGELLAVKYAHERNQTYSHLFRFVSGGRSSGLGTHSISSTTRSTISEESIVSSA